MSGIRRSTTLGLWLALLAASGPAWTADPEDWGHESLSLLVEGLRKAEVPGADLQDLFPRPGHFPALRLPSNWPDDAPRLLPRWTRWASGTRLELRNDLLPLLDERALRARERDPLQQVMSGKERSSGAESLALRWRIRGEARDLDAARAYLLAIPPPARVSGPEGARDSDWGDWIAASGVLRNYCLAYDLLRESLSSGERAAIEGQLGAMAHQMHRWLPLATPNNHASIIGGALIVAALTLSQDNGRHGSTPADWLESGSEAIRRGLAMLDRDGSYREGPYYSDFLARDLVPVLAVVRHALGVDVLAGGVFPLWIRWMLDLMRPDGTAPLTDDGWIEPSLWPWLLADRPESGAEISWRMLERAATWSDSDNLPEVLLAARPAAPRAPRRPPFAAYPRSGSVVLRSDWSPEGLYALFQAEPADRLAGYHEHQDALGLTLSAAGENWIVAPGYGRGGSRNTRHESLTRPRAQNVPLLDGKGPDPNPVYGDPEGARGLLALDSPSLDWSSALATIRGQSLRRDVVQIAGQAVLVLDRHPSAAPEDGPLGQRWRGRGDWHRLDERSGEWRRKGRRLQLHQLLPRPARLRERRELGSRDWFSWERQEVVELEQPVREGGSLPVLFLPRDAGGAGLRLREGPEGPGLARWRLQSAEGEGWILHSSAGALNMAALRQTLPQLSDELVLELLAAAREPSLLLCWQELQGRSSVFLAGLESGDTRIWIKDSGGTWRMDAPFEDAGAAGPPSGFRESIRGMRPPGIRVRHAAEKDPAAALRRLARLREGGIPPGTELQAEAQAEAIEAFTGAGEQWLAGHSLGDSLDALQALKLGTALLGQQYDAGDAAQLRLPLRWRRPLGREGGLELDLGLRLGPGHNQVVDSRLTRAQGARRQRLSFEQLQKGEEHTRLELEDGNDYASVEYHSQPGPDAAALRLERREEHRLTQLVSHGESSGRHRTAWSRWQGAQRLEASLGENAPGRWSLGLAGSRGQGIGRLSLSGRWVRERPAERLLSGRLALAPGASLYEVSLEDRAGDRLAGLLLQPAWREGSASLSLGGSALQEGTLGLRGRSGPWKLRLASALQLEKRPRLEDEFLELGLRRGPVLRDRFSLRALPKEGAVSRYRLRLQRDREGADLRLSGALLGHHPLRGPQDLGAGAGIGWRAGHLTVDLDLVRPQEGEAGLALRLERKSILLEGEGEWTSQGLRCWSLRLGNSQGQAIELRREGEARWLVGSVVWQW